jgi:hypothetical protein
MSSSVEYAPGPPDSRPPYVDSPVRVDAQLDPRLSRWMWLVKWILAIPHYIILVFLWIAFAVLTIIVFFAILFTGRYPRGIFEFNVGVMRWTWRVGYYAGSVFGTDRYPPFTLQDVPDYPARLQIAYPERLSRGLVLVKWWLLAIPHYLILGVFFGSSSGGGNHVEDGDTSYGYSSPGLVSVLVLISLIALLFTARYPSSLFNLIVGLERWGLRVGAYVALMTDQYPPFRLDQGGTDPATPTGPPAEPGASTRPLEQQPPQPPTAG